MVITSIFVTEYVTIIQYEYSNVIVKKLESRKFLSAYFYYGLYAIRLCDVLAHFPFHMVVGSAK